MNYKYYQHGYGKALGIALERQWSPDFRRYRYLVRFAGGIEHWSYPTKPPMSESEKDAYVRKHFRKIHKSK